MITDDRLATLESEGFKRIEWVRRHSPVLDGFVRQSLADGSIAGRRVAVVVHLEAKTAFLATILADAGAEVVVAGSNPLTTNGAVVAALRARGLRVLAEAGGDHASWERELRLAAELEPELIIDDGAELTMRVAKYRPDVFDRLQGVSEETTTGTQRLRQMDDRGDLPFAALTANDARCKHLFDNRYATGQTTIQAMLRLTNRQIGGATVAVIGYGYVGKGVAAYARAMGARVLVAEIDPVRALEAHTEGHTVGAARDVLPEAQFVVTATGGMRAISAADLPWLRHETVLANAGHHDLEIDTHALAAADEVLPSRTHVMTYTFAERVVHVLASGSLVNIAGGSGHPIETMDLTFAVQGLGIHYLAGRHELPAGVHVLPKALDDAIAAARLRSLGRTLDMLRDDQLDDQAHRFEGTQV